MVKTYKVFADPRRSPIARDLNEALKEENEATRQLFANVTHPDPAMQGLLRDPLFWRASLAPYELTAEEWRQLAHRVEQAAREQAAAFIRTLADAAGPDFRKPFDDRADQIERGD